MTPHLLLGLILLPGATAAAPTGVPLPPAPVRIVIPDAAAFDAAITGAYRRALTGKAEEADPVVAAWRRSQVGAKLEDQWGKLAGDLPWTWTEIMALHPRRLGLALLDAGSLDAVLVVEGGAAALPSPLAPGTAKTHGGIPYHLVARRSAAGAGESERRMGLSWARVDARLVLATSEEGLTLTLDEIRAGRSFDAPLAGLVSVLLDTTALAKDRYFRREFLFGSGAADGTVAAALRLEGGRLVEIREGRGDPGPAGADFDAPRAAASAWEPDGTTLLPALRGALLEPLSTLADRPVAPILPLPSVAAASTDRYLVNLEHAPAAETPWEEGDLAGWREIFRKNPVSGWGYALGVDGSRRLVFPWPERLDTELLALCEAAVTRRAGALTTVKSGEAREIRVGPDLPALALRRTGGYVWLGRSAAEVADAPTPDASPDLVRWARVDLDAARAEGPRWRRAEGPAAPERVRPLSDRILGLLGWIPETTSLRVERRRNAGGWTERVVFGGATR